jgi:hypothetical protein
LAYQLLADMVLIVHAAYAFFVVTGGFLALRWRPLLWVHPPAALWGIAVEFEGWLCPLTPLENRLRLMAGHAAYEGDFILHYVGGALYPAGLTRTLQLILGASAFLMNVIAYALIIRQRSQ